MAALVPAAVTRWVERFNGREVAVAVEACTGRLFVGTRVTRSSAIGLATEASVEVKQSSRSTDT